MVGSSRMSRLAGFSRSRSIASLLRSPPLSTETLLKTSSPRNRKDPRSVRSSGTRGVGAELSSSSMTCFSLVHASAFSCE